MDSFDKSFTDAIKKKLANRLNRKLTDIETSAFSLVRSGIAYEMIMDYISDNNESIEVLEKYVASVVKEYQVILGRNTTRF